jgi:beta-N-acetylglucosaminidase
VKIYRHPDIKDEVVQSFKIPSTIRLSELAIYNGRFFKIHDAEGKDWYVDANSIDYRIVTNTTLRRVGNIVTDKVRNVQLNLTERTNLTAYELKSITAGTNLEGIEDAVVEIEETYGVNALFTLSVAALESGWGNSYLARNRNNLFGICAYDNNVDAASSFASKSECVRYWGKLIANEYFAHGRTTAYSINAIYASNQSWADEVLDGMRRMANKI